MSDEAVEVEGLEVVAWQDAESPLYTTGEKRQMHGWANDGYPIVPLCSLPKARAIIDRLKDKLDYANQVIDQRHGMLNQLAARIAELQKDADRYRWLRHMTTKERTYIVQQEYDKVMDMFLDESMKGEKHE